VSTKNFWLIKQKEFIISPLLKGEGEVGNTEAKPRGIL